MGSFKENPLLHSPSLPKRRGWGDELEIIINSPPAPLSSEERGKKRG
jgi:hypothetical protein